MIGYYKLKGKDAGIKPKAKKSKKVNTFQIIIRDKSKSKQQSTATLPQNMEEIRSFIEACIKDKAILEFDYVDKKGTALRRCVEPQKMDLLNGSVVLYAFCIQNEGIRIFILANMKNLKKSELNGKREPRSTV